MKITEETLKKAGWYEIKKDVWEEKISDNLRFRYKLSKLHGGRDIWYLGITNSEAYYIGYILPQSFEDIQRIKKILEKEKNIPINLDTWEKINSKTWGKLDIKKKLLLYITEDGMLRIEQDYLDIVKLAVDDNIVKAIESDEELFTVPKEF